MAIKDSISNPISKKHIEFQKARAACSKKLSQQKRERWRKLMNVYFNDKSPTKQI